MVVTERSLRVAGARPYRSHVARMFVAHAEARGLDVDALIEDAGIQLDDAATVELPFAAMNALCDRIAELAGDPYAGLSIGSSLPPGAYGVVEYVFESSATVGEAVEMLVKFHPLTSELARGEIVHDRVANTLTFQHWLDHPRAHEAVQANEYALATYVRLGELRLGFRPRFVAVHVMHDRPERRRALEDHFAAPVVFGSPRNGLVLDADLLARPMFRADPGLLQIVTERAERDLSRVHQAGGLPATLASTLRTLLAETPHCAQAYDASRALGLSVRSLNRRLAENGVSFRAIEAEVKRALADEQLADPACSIDRVAAALGFASPSAFTRAYKRWTGRTPSETRR